MTFARKVARLEEGMAALPSLLVATSGGVDSGALLGAAARALPGRVLAATTASPAVPGEEIADAARMAAHLGVRHVVVSTAELHDPRYVANAGDRCYFCRREMYRVLAALAAREGIAHVADGLLADDPVADRPGVRAAGEAGVLHPLRAAGFVKADARRLARALGLHSFDKPAQPCLASRLPRGLAVTVERLARVHRAEAAVRSLGFREVRVRCEEEHGRVEVGRAQLAEARAREAEVAAAVVAAGFATAAVDPRGYRSGGAAGRLQARFRTEPSAGRAEGSRRRRRARGR